MATSASQSASGQAPRTGSSTPSISVDSSKDSRNGRGRGRGRGRGGGGAGGAGRNNPTPSPKPPTAQLPAKSAPAETAPKPEKSVPPAQKPTNDTSLSAPSRPAVQTTPSHSRQRRSQGTNTANTSPVTTSPADGKASPAPGPQPAKRPGNTRRRSSKKSTSLSSLASGGLIPPPLLMLPHDRFGKGPLSASLTAPLSAGTGPPSRPYTPSSHIDWAEDDDEGDLPDLNDWGVTSLAKSTLAPSAALLRPEKETLAVPRAKTPELQIARSRSQPGRERQRSKTGGRAPERSPRNSVALINSTLGATRPITKTPLVSEPLKPPEPAKPAPIAPSPAAAAAPAEAKPIPKLPVVPATVAPAAPPPKPELLEKSEVKEPIIPTGPKSSTPQAQAHPSPRSSPPPDWSKAPPSKDTLKSSASAPINNNNHVPTHQRHLTNPSPSLGNGNGNGNRRGGHAYSHSYSHPSQHLPPARSSNPRQFNAGSGPDKARSASPPNRAHSRPVISFNALNQVTKSLGVTSQGGAKSRLANSVTPPAVTEAAGS